ncbi:hypothetical protein [Streptomyces europaeiscabiei]|uniref:hypothetical protein n=1 Tax=Streptomyces europaeiscabiei TaxID=146819 RepID=UPI0029B40939|nr:hypothetical protein [Streptomyces europaeiscabiei]MDX3866839.1 hypothetical protein [Streptomyces europaeiscabiei]MDX3873132.1 hypothetical protein [Streptomyces europaeiscabiei]
MDTDQNDSAGTAGGIAAHAPPILSRTDGLVRRAARHPAWDRVDAETREALKALYAAMPVPPAVEEAPREQHLEEAKFRARLDELVSADPVLSHLVAEAASEETDDHRAVLPVPGRRPVPVRWGCPEAGCTRAPVAGESDGPYGSRHCASHPNAVLQRLS